MRTMKSFAAGALVVAAVLGLAGCAGMSAQDRNTAIGAGLGGVAGHVLTDGSTVGTIGGAAAGGLLGHQWENITK